jgi:hypothetical protein
MKRKSLARGVAALGAACLLLAPLATSARAADTPLPIYEASGIGQGIVTSLTLVPSVLTPLIETGTNYTKTSISSQGGGTSNSLAAQAYPGGLIVGAIGCGSPLPGWVQAQYPAVGKCKNDADATLFSVPPAGNKQMAALAQVTSLSTSHLAAGAHNANATSAITTQSFTVGGDTPVMTVGSLATTSNGISSDKTVENVVTTTAKDINLLGGLIRIQSLVSTSTAASDGTTGTAKGTLTMTGVTVVSGGTMYEASIDNDGLHVNQPGLTREQNLGLTESITEAFTKAGLSITTATPTKIVDGASGESSVGGLIISFNVTVPSVAVPPELAPVLAEIYGQIPTQCLPVGVCFGQGVLPSFGSQALLTFNIGSTDAFAVAGVGFQPVSGGFCTTCGVASPPASVLPQQITAPQFPQQAPAPPSQPQTTTGPLRLFGLVARLPAAALLWGGVGLLFLAVAYSFGPSLRHGRAS